MSSELNEKNKEYYEGWEILKMFKEGVFKDGCKFEGFVDDVYESSSIKEFKIINEDGIRYIAEIMCEDKYDIISFWTLLNIKFKIKKSQPKLISFEEVLSTDEKIMFRPSGSIYFVKRGLFLNRYKYFNEFASFRDIMEELTRILPSWMLRMAIKEGKWYIED